MLFAEKASVVTTLLRARYTGPQFITPRVGVYRNEMRTRPGRGVRSAANTPVAANQFVGTIPKPPFESASKR